MVPGYFRMESQDAVVETLNGAAVVDIHVVANH